MVEELKQRNEQLQKDWEKLKKILKRYEDRRDGLVEQIAIEKAELFKGGTL
jgi:kinetochore protein NDC80